MIIDGEKFACEACVRGHRVSNCQHSGKSIGSPRTAVVNWARAVSLLPLPARGPACSCAALHCATHGGRAGLLARANALHRLASLQSAPENKHVRSSSLLTYPARPDRPLQHINKKGRPVSQCQHCRSMRKSRSSHIKCDCGEKTSKCAHLQQTVDGHNGEQLEPLRCASP